MRGTVYPRVCGGTTSDISTSMSEKGLSPRVRGNPTSVYDAAEPTRSIPACAGEPNQWLVLMGLHTVYPRVCGGTHARGERQMSTEGLSPRVRGNPTDFSLCTPIMRSIPACAGEPPCQLQRGAQGRVYPRVCGGTGAVLQAHDRGGGLSPRVRGNRPSRSASSMGVRSIPACAGEPGIPATRVYAWRVYPRVCGGTGNTDIGHTDTAGLSPRVRGNRVCPAHASILRGSIPACAGEPVLQIAPVQTIWVYPRVCGGTVART